MPAQPTIYVVDDDAAVRDSLEALLESAGFSVELHGSGKDFLQRVDRSRYGCLILDLHLPWMSGLEVLEHMDKTGIDIPTILVTGRGDPDVKAQALKANAVAFFEKPLRDDVLLDAINRALEAGGKDGNLE